MISLLKGRGPGIQILGKLGRTIPDDRVDHGMIARPPLCTMNPSSLLLLAVIGTLALQGPSYGQMDEPAGKKRAPRDLQRGRGKTVPVGQMTDLTSRANVIIFPKDRDNFSAEFVYQVSVKNMSAEPFTVESLILVVDKVTDIAGKDALMRVDLGHVEVVGQDGETPEGKPYFKIPLGQTHELAPYTESEQITVRVRNPNYTIVIRPVFRVLGLVHTSASVGDLIDLLIQKGILTEEEGLALMGSKPQPSP
jgi:hypothetical protein